MFSQLYPFTYIATLAALTLWFYLRESERLSENIRKIFYACLIAFGTNWLLSKGDLPYKFIVLGRELLILAVVPVVLGLFRKAKWLFLTMAVVTFAMLRVFYFDKLKQTFPQQPKSENTEAFSQPSGEKVPLDPTGELLIEIKDGRQIADIQQVLDAFGLTATSAFVLKDKDFTDLDDYFIINVPPKFEDELSKVKAALDAIGQVEWLEENEQMTLSPMETEAKVKPDLKKKFGLNDPGVQCLWGFEEMKVEDLYAALKDRKPVKKAMVAILDTGVDAAHEDIATNFRSTQAKYDTDKASHGTHCAGIAAAVSNNEKGVASFSQTNEFVQVTSIKVLTDGGYGTQQMIIQGILEAADAGVDVASLSLGGRSNDAVQRAYKKAVDYANRKGVIVVVAAGNSNRSAKDYSPANTPGVIAVSAVDTLLNRASFSNKIDDLKMGVAAPGVKIYSTIPGSQYKTYNGTSMATPYVAGLLGLMKSLKPSLTTAEAFKILNATGRETKQSKETGKLIQPGAAVKKLE